MAAIVDECLPHEAALTRQWSLWIVDIGGSKGHLVEHLAERFGDRVNVSVVDIGRGVYLRARRVQGGVPNCFPEVARVPTCILLLETRRSSLAMAYSAVLISCSACTHAVGLATSSSRTRSRIAPHSQCVRAASLATRGFKYLPLGPTTALCHVTHGSTTVPRPPRRPRPRCTRC